MIVEINETNKIERADVLDQIHVLRHKVFVEELAWDGIQSIDGREYDEFDVSDTVYLAMLDDETGELLSTLRIQRCDRPNLTAKVFPHLVQFMPMPSTPDIIDISRIVISPTLGKDRIGKAGWEIFSAAGDYARNNGIRASMGIMSPHFFKRVTQGGIDVRPLGFPVGKGRDAYFAALMPVYAGGFHKELPDPNLIFGFENPPLQRAA